MEQITKQIEKTKSLNDLLKPTGDLVYIKNPSKEEIDEYKSASGIILGKKIATDEYFYEVLAVGDLVTNCKIGDRILIDVNCTSTNVPVRVCNKIEFIVIRGFNVFGVLK